MGCAALDAILMPLSCLFRSTTLGHSCLTGFFYGGTQRVNGYRLGSATQDSNKFHTLSNVPCLIIVYQKIPSGILGACFPQCRMPENGRKGISVIMIKLYLFDEALVVYPRTTRV